MRKEWLLALGILAAATFACGDDDSGSDVPQDADVDVEGGADADADADGDVETDVPAEAEAEAGADADADGDAETDVPAEAEAEAGADADADAADGGAAALLSSISGQWHGMIGTGYRNGCMCLTLDAAGNVIAPSGITLGFTITGGSTTVVDAATREIDIRTIVSGTPFHILDAFVNADSTLIDGQWQGETIHDFDDTIRLDRDPQSCEARTGLTGAPC